MNGLLSPRACARFLMLATAAIWLGGCSDLLTRPGDGASVSAGNAQVTDTASASIAKPTPRPAVPVTVKPVAPAPKKVETSLWARIRDHMQLKVTSEIARARVETQMRWFIAHPSYLERVSQRAQPFLYMIVQDVRRRGIPIDIALLPIVESGFQPFAYSDGRAAGLWQFIPSTGRRFGLQQDWWYDGRRDVKAETNAALDYLSQLAGQFNGNWLLALASYNAGEGTVLNAIERNRRRGLPTDFWHLKLPVETANYVPRLLAVARLVADPGAFGVHLAAIPNRPQLADVDVGSQIDLARAADLAGMSLEGLHRLNPAFNRWATDPKGPHKLLVPVADVKRFRAGLAALPKDERIQWRRHVIRPGDSLSVIAARYHTTTEVLARLNRLPGNRIVVGHALLVPVSLRPLSDYKLTVAERMIACRDQWHPGRRESYTVARGDSFWSIARAHGVTTHQLAAWNGMAPGDRLSVGRKLVIWASGRARAHGWHRAARNPMIRTISYQVRRGDSLYLIGRKFGVSVRDLRHWNSRLVSQVLQPGQRLTVQVNLANPGSA